MLPPFPIQPPILGPTLYGELCLALCRALVAPWLGASLPPRSRHEAGAAEIAQASPVPRAETSEPAPRPPGQVIHVPAARWRQRRAPRGTAAV
jgi:hypothetical protein